MENLLTTCARRKRASNSSKVISPNMSVTCAGPITMIFQHGGFDGGLVETPSFLQRC